MAVWEVVTVLRSCFLVVLIQKPSVHQQRTQLYTMPFLACCVSALPSGDNHFHCDALLYNYWWDCSELFLQPCAWVGCEIWAIAAVSLLLKTRGLLQFIALDHGSCAAPLLDIWPLGSKYTERGRASERALGGYSLLGGFHSTFRIWISHVSGMPHQTPRKGLRVLWPCEMHLLRHDACL